MKISPASGSMESRGTCLAGHSGMAAARALLSILLAAGPDSSAVAVRHVEGVLHGFLVLKSVSGERLGDGDLIQTTRGGQVTARLVFHLKDGSVHDETAVFSQEGSFRLVRDHLVQRGPSFPRDEETTVDAPSGRVTVRTRDHSGREKLETKDLALPGDVANGLMLTLMKNLDPRSAAPTTVSMVATASSPRLVHVVVSKDGEDPFVIGGTSHRAIRYRAHIEIGGLAGIAAKLLGKQPPDTFVWILPGEAPAFVKSEGPLAFDAPVWRIELASPVWPRGEAVPSR
jgi:hypothetical protein